jgi:hypothetical protein
MNILPPPDALDVHGMRPDSAAGRKLRADMTEDVIVDAEETRGINITLRPGDVAQTVTVTTSAAP